MCSRCSPRGQCCALVIVVNDSVCLVEQILSLKQDVRVTILETFDLVILILVNVAADPRAIDGGFERMRVMLFAVEGFENAVHVVEHAGTVAV